MNEWSEEIICENCGAEYEVHHNEKMNVEYCAFCGELLPTDEEEFEEDWFDDDEE